MITMGKHWETIRRLQDEWGFRPLPCPPTEGNAGKHPHVDWTDYKAEPPSIEETREWFGHPGYGVWSVMGPITGWVNLDTDNAAGEALWRERIGDLMDRTTCVRTRKGFHYYFRLPEGASFPTWTWKTDPEAKDRGARFEVLGHGNGAMLPPSFFPDGPADDGRTQYEWVRGPECALELPELLRKPSPSAGRAPGRHSPPVENTRSTLAGLLNDRPEPHMGLRNDWHNKVSGHFAKLIPYEDGFLALATVINDSLSLPSDELEVRKTWMQAWKAEHDKGTMGREETGWLSSDGRRLYTVVKVRDGDDRQQTLPYPWLNGDLRVTGVNEDDTGSRAYEVLITREDGTQISDIVKPSRLSNGAEQWLGNFGLSVVKPPGGKTEIVQNASVGARLIRYFESQKPPRFKVVPCLGWDHESQTFLTPDGAILGTPGELGLSPFQGCRPRPEIAQNNLVNVRYGFDGSEEEALEVLREVMHFHFEDFTAVFASFCVASVLKGQLEPFTNVWPYPVVEAPSGSSKSSGFIPMIQQLIGRKGKAGTFTKPSARDALGAHRCLPEWIDDPDDLNNVKELLRLCASGGTAKRKGGVDFTKNIETALVQTPIITSEGINLDDQKAYADRMIKLHLRQPHSRTSRHSPPGEPPVPQINDIDDLRSKYSGDLSCLAGHVVSLILQKRFSCTPERFREYRAGHPGRHADKLAILKMGAFVLVELLGPDFGWVMVEVDRWIDSQDYNPNANRFTSRLVPDALSLLGSHITPVHRAGEAPTPVLVRPDKHGVLALWVNPRHLALWWHQKMNGRIEERTDTEEAINQQAVALGMKGFRAGELNVDFIKPNYNTPMGSKTNAIYRRIPDSVGQKIILGLGLQVASAGAGGSGTRHAGRTPHAPTPDAGAPPTQRQSAKKLGHDTVASLNLIRDHGQPPRRTPGGAPEEP